MEVGATKEPRPLVKAPLLGTGKGTRWLLPTSHPLVSYQDFLLCFWKAQGLWTVSSGLVGWLGPESFVMPGLPVLGRERTSSHVSFIADTCTWNQSPVTISTWIKAAQDHQTWRLEGISKFIRAERGRRPDCRWRGGGASVGTGMGPSATGCLCPEARRGRRLWPHCMGKSGDTGTRRLPLGGEWLSLQMFIVREGKGFQENKFGCMFCSPLYPE